MAKEKEKIAELVKSVKRAVLEGKKDILDLSTNLEDCLNRVRECVDSVVMNFVMKDAFLKIIPDGSLRKLESKLKASFEESYRKLMIKW